jgi:ABC-type nitrate/sulfonate/bicarbonate transport system substrate-binding protein
MITRRDWLRGMGATAALALARPGLRAQTAAGTPATMQLGWIWNVEYAGELMAEVNGHYAAEGLDLDLRPGGPQVDETVMVMARKAIVTASDVMTAGQATNHGAHLKLIAATFQRVAFSITSLPDKPIRTPHDLPGKKIGAATKQLWALKFLCAANKIDPASLTLLPVGFDPAPLVNRQVDGFLSFVTNQPVQLAAQGIETVSMVFADYGLSEFSDNLAVRADTLADPAQRALVVKILRGTIRGWQDAIAKPEAAAQAMVARYGAQYGLNEAVQLATMRAQMPFLTSAETAKNGLLSMSEETIAANIAMMAAVGVPIRRDLFDTTLLQEIFQGRAQV